VLALWPNTQSIFMNVFNIYVNVVSIGMQKDGLCSSSSLLSVQTQF
jgi:hypothetical protein